MSTTFPATMFYREADGTYSEVRVVRTVGTKSYVWWPGDTAGTWVSNQRLSVKGKK